VKALRLALRAVGVARTHASIAFWSLVARARLRLHGASVGRRLRVRGPLRFYCHPDGRIRIGDDCRIQSGFAGNPVGGGSRMAFWVGAGGRLSIGDRAGLSNSTIVCMDAVSIGDDVYLGGGSGVYDTNFHSMDAEERSRPRNRGVRTAPVAIRRRAFVGGHTLVLKGVTIGEEAVIGAGSVVRAPVPAGEVWAGNPAHRLREARARRVRSLARHDAASGTEAAG
jgi:acetyltransferase-like isoleucine patch superfamily enzyme